MEEELNKSVDKKKNIGKTLFFIGSVLSCLIIFNLLLYASTKVSYVAYNSVEFVSIVFINPIILIIFGVLYGLKYGFSWFYAAMLSACFFPSIIIFLSAPFAFYIPIYFIFLIASELCGISIIKINKE